MQVQFNVVAGPYKGYCGRAEYDPDAQLFHGEIAGTQDVVTFQGRSPEELAKAFQDSVDDYLEFCEESGQPPEKPFSGKFMARIPPELHRAVSAMALAAGKSLNQYLCDTLEAIVKTSSWPEPEPCKPTKKAGARQSRPGAVRYTKKQIKAEMAKLPRRREYA